LLRASLMSHLRLHRRSSRRPSQLLTFASGNRSPDRSAEHEPLLMGQTTDYGNPSHSLNMVDEDLEEEEDGVTFPGNSSEPDSPDRPLPSLKQQPSPLRRSRANSRASVAPSRTGSVAAFKHINVASWSPGKLVRDKLPPDMVPMYISIALVLGYLVAGTLFYTFAPRELNDAGTDMDHADAGFVDGFYYTVVSLTTVGYGDVVPYTPAAKLISIFFLFTGVGVLGYCIGFALDTLGRLAAEKEQVQKAKEMAAAEEKERMSLDESRVVYATNSDGTERTPFREKVSEFFGEALVMQAIGMLIMMVLGMVLMYIDGGPAAPPGSPQASNSSLPRHNATIVDSLYFASVSITTVGYGDFTPVTKAGKILCSLYLFIATALFGAIVGTIAQIPLDRRQNKADAAVLSHFGRDLSVRELEDLCQGGANENECTRAEFILRMLVWLDRVALDDILKCGEQFDILDKSGDGVLDLEDCRATSAENRWAVVRHSIRLILMMSRLGMMKSEERRASTEPTASAASPAAPASAESREGDSDGGSGNGGDGGDGGDGNGNGNGDGDSYSDGNGGGDSYSVGNGGGNGDGHSNGDSDSSAEMDQMPIRRRSSAAVFTAEDHAEFILHVEAAQGQAAVANAPTFASTEAEATHFQELEESDESDEDAEQAAPAPATASAPVPAPVADAPSLAPAEVMDAPALAAASSSAVAEVPPSP